MVCAALVPLVASTQPAADFDKYVAQGARDWHVPGMAVAVVKDDSIVFQKAYGVRDVNTKAPFDLHTRSAIGSTTKAMTVMALGMLVDEKKLSWDDRVIDHLPDFRLSDAYVTRDLRIRDLLTHRSGLGGSGDLLWVNPDLSEQDIVRRMRYMPFESPMRTRWSYNNIMYQVAGDVVAQASGMSWEQFITTRIFQPLGMTESIPLVSATAGQPNVTSAHEYKNDTTKVIPFQSTDQVKAAGSVFSSISDMTRWMQFLLDSGKVNGKRLVSDSVFREIFKPEIPADRSTYPALTESHPHFFDYGFGFFLQDYAGQFVAMHTGSINGMCALIALVPDRHLGIYVLENVDHAELRHALMYKAIDQWLGTGNRDWSADLHKMFEERTAKVVAARSKTARDSASPPASLPLDRYAGTYSDSVFGDVVITNDGGLLHLKYFSGSAQLDHQKYDVFKASHPNRSYLDGQTVTFTPDGSGGVSAARFLGERFARAKTPEGVAVIEKMHDRYASTWYSSLSFTELAEQQAADGKKTSETWWEEGKLPGKLRIDVGTTPTDTKPRRIIVFANDSAYVKAPGQDLKRSARLNLLLVLGFDVYRQPVDRTVAELTAEGFDLSRVRTDTWKGRPAIVVGGEGKQFWIDAERQVFLRLVDGTSEDWFDDYRPLAGGWIAAEVGITDKGVMRLHEVYSNIKANVALPDAMFDPASLH
ncbi:MAG TPA: serine hydrolase [Gemmatimonadaceae bacterium]|nr:serine hydrolase [Gemmatimonadaceae bacterium]